MIRSPLLSTFTKFLSRLFLSDPIDILSALLRWMKRRLTRRQSGMYELLDYEAELELCDDKGTKSILSKRQTVRFLQDNTIAYQDTAWGDGDIFANYRCTPGKLVDRYQEGHLWWLLISLQDIKNWGDEEDFHISRTIRDGFTHQRESLQIEIRHPTQYLQMRIIFPPKRHPKKVTVIEKNRRYTTPLDTKHLHLLPDGRLKATWEIKKPRLFESYILRWHW